MTEQLVEFWLWQFWLGLVSLGVGLAVVAPCLLVPSWRRRILKADVDIEGVGLITLVVAMVAVGCYNYIGSRIGH